MKKEIKIVQAHFVEEFTKLVNEELSYGWELSGGMSVVITTSYRTMFYQALVRNTNNSVPVAK